MRGRFSRREFLQHLSGIGAYAFLASSGIYLYGCDERKHQTAINSLKFIGNPKYKRVILLGMDGLDPKLLSHLMSKGQLPSFSRLGRMGDYSPLATSNPAQSPVAWASIATGNDPGYHGIFDFLNRRVTDHMPELAIFKVNSGNFLGRRESMFLPAMEGNSFWDYTSANNVPSTILRWPVTFQPKKNEAKLYAGLGVPDLNGRFGTYSYYTTARVPDDAKGAEKVTRVRLRGNRIKTEIAGPNVSGIASGDQAKTELNITLLQDKSAVKVEAGGKTMTISRKKWSGWFEIDFKVGMMKTVSGIVKFYLNEVAPDFEMYMTAIQINPKDPAFVITNPDNYIKELSGDLGHFYTLGISEDTKALSEGRLDEEAFIAMCDEITNEQEDMLWNELNKFKAGVFAFNFFSTDRIQHMFWSTRVNGHPLYTDAYARRYGHVIDGYYIRMDRILGELMKNLDSSTALIAFSDHGFSTLRRTININTWLAEKGFMKLKRKVDKHDKEGGPLFQHVDWNQTYAYSLGFGSIYINMKGREKYGVVDPGAGARSVMDKISQELMALKDPKYGKSSVMNVYRSDTIYSGSNMDKSPDLVVGFQNGYRASWQTAIGGAPLGVFHDNLEKWSGDHIMDPSIVPGIVLTNFKTNVVKPGLMDIAPTVLSCFGMSSSDMKGKALL